MDCEKIDVSFLKLVFLAAYENWATDPYTDDSTLDAVIQAVQEEGATNDQIRAWMVEAFNGNR